MADSKKYNGSTWEHSLRKLTTDTDTITTLPVDIYADGNNATVGISGNTVQSGTPTPDNPIMPQGTGERTGNLWDEDYIGISYMLTYKPLYVGNGDYTLSSSIPNGENGVKNLFLLAGNVSSGASSASNGVASNISKTVTAIDGYVTIAFRSNTVDNPYNPADYNTILNTGSTALPYEPYGYKIPILINETITNIYIGDNPLRKSLDGTAYDTLAADGTLTQRVDSDGSVLATPIVTQITMPTFTLADGANTVSVDTTVQPSEMTMTYRGWHDASVKEWDGSQWQ